MSLESDVEQLRNKIAAINKRIEQLEEKLTPIEYPKFKTAFLFNISDPLDSTVYPVKVDLIPKKEPYIQVLPPIHVEDGKWNLAKEIGILNLLYEAAMNMFVTGSYPVILENTSILRCRDDDPLSFKRQIVRDIYEKNSLWFYDETVLDARLRTQLWEQARAIYLSGLRLPEEENEQEDR